MAWTHWKTSRHEIQVSFTSFGIWLVLGLVNEREKGAHAHAHSAPSYGINALTELSPVATFRVFLYFAIIIAEMYRVTIPLVQNLLLTSNKSSALAWPGQARPGQNGTFVLKSTGG